MRAETAKKMDPVHQRHVRINQAQVCLVNESSGCKRVVGTFGSQVSRSLLAKLVINEGH